jgi:hypothetical protein
MRILIFGGLTAVGTSITNHFLQEGIETKVVKSTPIKEAEEEQEFFFGRNEMYRAIESCSDLEGNEAIDTVCFAGHFDDDKKGTVKVELFNNLETILERFPSLRTVILLSHVAVDEAGEDKRTLLDERALLKEIEVGFKTHFENRGEALKRRLFVLRLPNLTSKEKDLLSLDPKTEKIDINEMAKSVFELTNLEHKNGVHTFRLERRNEPESKKGGDISPLVIEEITP